MSEEEVVVATVAVDDVQALVYRKLLRNNGIQVLLVDPDDTVFQADPVPRKTKQDVKVVVRAEDSERAIQLIREFESKRETKVISKSGEHILFRCRNCQMYLFFPITDAGTRQQCPECLQLIRLPK